MEERTHLREFASYASLSVCAMLAISCYILADTFFVAQGLGTAGLAALNLAIPAYNFIYGAGLMLGMGGATKYAICKSRGEHQAANHMFTHSVWLSAGISLLFMLAGLLLSWPLTRLLGAEGEVAVMTHTYLRVLLLFSPAFIFNAMLVCFVRNDGRPTLAMAATASGSFANIILDYVFIFPCNMGIFGAVFATGLSPVIGIVVMAPHLLGKRRGFRLAPTRPQARMVADNLSLGFPSLLGQVSSGVVMITFNALILGLEGNVGVAAYGVTANLSLVVTSIYTGIAQGSQPLISRAWGEREPRLARLYLRYGLWTMLAVSGVIYLILFVFAGPIAGIFNSERDPDLQRIAVEGLRLYFLSAPFAGFNIVLASYFTSVEQAAPAQVLSLLRGLILIIPAALVMAALWDMTGVWLACPAAELLVALLGVWLYRRSGRVLLSAGA